MNTPSDPLRRVDLTPDSLLYFVHIPKTAGTSMRRYLDRYFLPQQVFPPELTVGPACHDGQLLASYSIGALSQFRLVGGHHDCAHLGNYLRACRNVVHQMTVLRDPVDQLLSEYKMLKSDPRYPHHAVHHQLSLDEFLDHPDFPWIRMGNRQIGHLMAQLTSDDPTRYRDGGLSVIQKQLLGFAAVGIHEQLEQSLQLFSYVFGWLAPDEVPHMNRAAVDQPDLTAAQRERIAELTTVDRQLYEWARRRFNDQYQQMMVELGLIKEQPSDDWAIAGSTVRAVPDADSRRSLRSAINAAADQRRLERLNRDDETAICEVIESEGFLPGHLNRDWRRYIQWIGPRPEATVKLAFRRAVDCLLYVRVDNAIKKKMLDHFTVRLNGHPIPMQWTPSGAAHHFVGFVPRQLIGQSRGSTLLTLKTSSVAAPVEVNPASTDTEVKCLAISSIELRPAVAVEPMDAPAVSRLRAVGHPDDDGQVERQRRAA